MSAVSAVETVFYFFNFFYRDASVSSGGKIDQFAPADLRHPHTPLRLRVGEISRFCFAEKCRYVALAMKSMRPARRNVRNCPPLRGIDRLTLSRAKPVNSLRRDFALSISLQFHRVIARCAVCVEKSINRVCYP